MAYILHIDTSADSSLIAISKGGEILAHTINEEARNHASTINKNIEYILESSSITLKDIDAITVCDGPGSYTGLRIGVSTAKGICYALDKSLMMDSKLLLIAYDLWYNLNKKLDNHIDQFYSILPAREREYFVSGYNKGFTEILKPCHMSENEVTKLNFTSTTAIIGELCEKMQQLVTQKGATYKHILKSKEANRNSWAKYALKQYESNAFVSLANSEPNYLKKVYTHKPKTSK